MMYPMHKNGEISWHVIALGLFRTFRIQVQTGIHVDNAGLDGNERYVAGVFQDIVPTGECRGMDFIRRDNETMESTAQQVSGCGHSRNNRKYREQPDFSKHSQNASGSIFMARSEIQRIGTVLNMTRPAAHSRWISQVSGKIVTAW